MKKKSPVIKSIYSPQYEYLISRLRKARVESGLKQQVIADKIGRYQSYLSKIEHGDRRIDVLELLELARLYKKDLSYFVPPKRLAPKQEDLKKKRKRR